MSARVDTATDPVTPAELKPTGRSAILRTSDPSAVDAFLASGTRHAYQRVDVVLSCGISDSRPLSMAMAVDIATQTDAAAPGMSSDQPSGRSMQEQAADGMSPVAAAVESNCAAPPAAPHPTAISGTGRVV